MEQKIQEEDTKQLPSWSVVEKENIKTIGFPNRSDELGALATGLAKAQLEMPVAKTNSVNPFYKSNYADLASIVRASRPALAKNGLCVIQSILETEEHPPQLNTMLLHVSGQWVESRVSVNPEKKDVHSFAAKLTYLKRYSYASICGVVADGEDDDGNSAMPEKEKEKAKTKTKTKKIADAITNTEYTRLVSELYEREDILDRILMKHNITSLRSLPSDEYVKCLNGILALKAAENFGAEDENK